MFKNPASNFCYCIFILFFSLPVFANTLPSCTGGNVINQGGDQNCSTAPTSWSNYVSYCYSSPGRCIEVVVAACGPTTYRCRSAVASCPPGSVLNSSTGYCEQQSVDTPQECGITGFPIWNGSGYDCVEDFDTPCPEGTTNGQYTLPGYDPRPYCTDANPPASSSSGAASSDGGSNSSSGDGGDDGGESGSSSGGETGNSSAASSASSSGGNGNASSGAASSSGGGGSASSGSNLSGQCDPTAKNYLECLNSKELNLPSEKGSFDGQGDSAEDRIGELEGELTDLFSQIQSEIQDVTGSSVSGSGAMTDICYQIMTVQVCFGWSRWAEHLSIIGTAIMGLAGVVSFIIIMRQ